jgi:hypothetical protein
MSLFYKDDSNRYESLKTANVWFAVVGLFIGITVIWMAFYPNYRVWSSAKAGEAELAQAEYNRQIKTVEAQAEKDSASLKAEAEVIRAGGVSKANEVVAKGLGGPEGYLRYLYIHMLEGQQNQIIYLPTEAGLPILEAGKR